MMSESCYSTLTDPEVALGVECALPWNLAPALARVCPETIGDSAENRTISRNSYKNSNTSAPIRSVFIPKLV